MKYARLFCCLVILILFSCSRNRGDVIKISNPISCRLEEVSSSIHVIPLEQSDTSSFVFDPFSIKVYGTRLFMFDAHTRTVRYYDDGNLVGVLNKRGRGYGEYIDIGTYAYNVKRDELVIFERNTKKIKSYSCKDFSFQREIQMDKYINAMEYLSGDRYLYVNDIPYDEKSTTAEIYDENAAVVISSIPIPGTAAGIIEDCVLCRSSNGSVSFVLPGYDNTVYQVTSDGFTKIASFSFGASGVSKKFWNGKIDDPFYGYDFFQKNEKREVGVAPSFYHREKESVSSEHASVR